MRNAEGHPGPLYTFAVLRLDRPKLAMYLTGLSNSSALSLTRLGLAKKGFSISDSSSKPNSSIQLLRPKTFQLSREFQSNISFHVAITANTSIIYALSAVEASVTPSLT